MIRQRERGYSLIEVLVAVLVLSLGLAGMASAMLFSVSSSRSAYIKSQATVLANAAADNMRANLVAYVGGFYQNRTTATAVTCTDDICTDTQLAGNDFAAWQAEVTATLPGGVGIICTDSTPNDGQPNSAACDGNGYNVVKIWWSDSFDNSKPANEAFHRFTTTIFP